MIDLFALEKKVKNELQDCSKEECISKLHEQLGCLHGGLMTKNWDLIEYHYEAAQFILENYYKKSTYCLANNISGNGYGDDHEWVEVAFIPDKLPSKQPHMRHSIWKCKNCSTRFRHYYRQIPDIFEQIKEYNIPQICVRDLICNK